MSFLEGGLHVGLCGGGVLLVGELVDWEDVAIVVLIGCASLVDAIFEGLVAVVVDVEVGGQALVASA